MADSKDTTTAALEARIEQLEGRLDQVIDLVGADLSKKTAAQLGKCKSTSKTQQKKGGK